jgi:hypothetical protein
MAKGDAHQIASAVTTLINGAVRKHKTIKGAGMTMRHAKHLREVVERHVAGGGKPVRLTITVP